MTRPSRPYPRGAHICHLYHDDEDRREVVASFVEGGLSRGEVVAFFPDVNPDNEAAAAVESLGIVPVEREEPPHLIASSAVSIYCPGNCFAPESMLAWLEDFHVRGCGEGTRGTRMAAEMTWALRGIPGSEHLIQYEAGIDGVLARYPSTLLCQYDMRRFDGATGFAVLGVHPLVMVHGRAIPNPY